MNYRIVFMGTPSFSVPALDALYQAGFDIRLVVSQPDRPQGRKQEILPTPVAARAAQLGLPLVQPAKVKDQAFLDMIREADPDFIVTAAYGRILTPEVLAVPRLGAVNVHASLLPAYRGASPVHWAIINGDEKTGISIMLMDEQMDHGDILARFELDIPEYITSDLLMERLGELGGKMLPDVLRQFGRGGLKAEPQRHEDATYVKMLTREDGQIDWNRSSFQIHNLIRGTYPWPGAYTSWKGKRLKIHRARIDDYPEETLKKYGKPAEPGTVIESHKDRIAVACGQGVLELTELQPAGSRRLRAEEISHNILPGTILGGDEEDQ